MTKRHKPAPQHQRRHAAPTPSKARITKGWIGIALATIVIVVIMFLLRRSGDQAPVNSNTLNSQTRTQKTFSNKWLQRAYDIDRRFHAVYTPCWEGANGAIGDAYLFAATHDTTILLFHLIDHDMRRMCAGTWVDDRAWVALAELYWWRFTGKSNIALVMDAKQRYDEARAEGRLSHHEGYWTWYNWPPKAAVNERIFTNSNMNQMLSVACGLYEALGDRKYLDDALLVWSGDGKTPGIEKTLYKGNGVWEGKSGRAAFGKEIPWNGTEYCSMGAALYRVTREPRLKQIIVTTAKRILNPATGWVDAEDFFQVHMDGNGNFVQYLMDAYEVAPDELAEVPTKVGKMLEHVWTNHHGRAAVMLHREADHAIRNGWNPLGGEDGYGVNEIGTVHAQSQAVRAFGVFAYYASKAR